MERAILKEQTMETVHHPSHYKPGTYEAIKVIEAWDLNFNLGSVLNYICIRKDKGSEIEDLEKAKQYIQFEIDRLKEAEDNKPIDYEITNACDDYIDSVIETKSRRVKEEMEKYDKILSELRLDCIKSLLIKYGKDK